MCGIVGSAGVPKHKEQAYSLITNLLRETKRRGRHATGFYAVDLEGNPFFHKEGISADAYVRRREWKQMCLGSKCMIGHARFTTQGSAKDNINNHPHLSRNENIALVHNGIVFNYDDEKDKYAKSLISECDSELILRMICREKDIVRGIKKVFKILGTGGDFACELIHRKADGSATFYFFRDDGRPGRLIDAREELGQFIFCSERAIWNDAVLKSGMSRTIRQLPVVDIDPYAILVIDADTLESKIIKVDKPVKVRRSRIRTTSYGTGYGGGYGWDEDDYYGGIYSGGHHSRRSGGSNWGGGAPNHSSSTTRVDVDDIIKDASKSGKSVLDHHWIETKNEKGLPRFVYDPEKELEVKPDLSEEDTQPIAPDDVAMSEEYLRQLALGIDDESERYSGWEDDAFTAGIIDQDEYAKIRSGSEDALDNADSFDDCDFPTDDELDDLGEQLTVQSDDELINNIDPDDEGWEHIM